MSYINVFANLPNFGSPDGIRCDADGRVYSSSGDGVYVYMPYPDGRLIGRIVTGGVQNLCFGGEDRCTLFIASQNKILSVPLKVTGAVWKKKIQVEANDESLQITWAWPSTGFGLETSTMLETGIWTRIPDPPTPTNGLNQVQLPTTNQAAFFRLNLSTP